MPVPDCTDGISFALTSGQMNIWALETAVPSSSVNNVCASLKFSGDVAPETVARAASDAAAEDPALRTRIRVENGTPVQYRSDEVPAVRTAAFSGSTEDEFIAWADAEAQKPFFGTDSPLCEFSVCRAGVNTVFLFIKLHHIICDGYSAGDLCRRIAGRVIFGDAYEAPRRYDYAGYAATERKYLASAAHEADREYWEKRLALPAEAAAVGNGVKSLTFKAKRASVKFAPEFLRKLSDFCSGSRLSPFVVFYGALAEYLHRAGSTDCISIGVPVINRQTFVQKNTTGMFVSTVPFIFEIDDGLSFEEYLLTVGDAWTDVLRHQRFPFREMRTPGSGGASSFRTMLSFQPDLSVGEGSDSVSVSGRWHFSGCQEEQLCVHLTGAAETLCAEYDYNASELCERDVLSVHDRICRMIEDGIARPGKKVYELEMTDGKDASVLYGRTAAVPDLTPYGLVSSVSPDVPAVICGGRTLSYGELCAKARALASEIKNADICAVALEPGEGTFVSVTAAMYAGCGWLTLAPGLPGGRLSAMLRKAGAGCVITDKPLPEGTVLPGNCRITDYETAVSGSGTSFVPRRQNESDTAYEVFTSGSTGTPKGVAISVKSLCSLAYAMKDVYPDRPLVSVCNPGFDAFIIDCAAALMNGRTVIMTTEEERGNASLLAGLIEKYGAGMISLTPSRLSALLDSAEFGKAASGLQCIICGGEPFGPGLVGKIRRYSSARVYNQYGPSETAVAVSMSEVREGCAVTAGKPLQNCVLYVMDRHMRPLPSGMKGDLYIGGACVGKGYVNEPVLTGAAFVQTGYGRLYKSGDLAYVDGNGELVICGRRDGQVKIRGLRVELQEIVSRIASFGGVTGAAAKLADIAGQKVIIGYYTSERELSELAISSFCAEYLPDYMVPARILRIEKIPLTSNGKTDVRSLPVPETDGTGALPANPRQELILGIFRDVLGHTDIYADSSYFLCGGNSLNAMETLRRIADETGVSLTVSALYACRTAAGLDEYMSASADTAAGKKPLTGIPGDFTGLLPMTPAQENIYLSASMDKSGRAYQMPCVLDTGEIDCGRFVRAFGRFAEDEPIFRASFVRHGGRAMMRLEKECALSLRFADEMTDGEIIRALTEPFDLSSAPLFRAYAKKNGKGGLRLFLNAHHIIADGLSVNILLDRLGRFYDGTGAEPHLSLADLASYYAENGDGDPADAEYWKKVLEGCPEYTDIPDDSPRPAFPDFRGDAFSVTLDAGTDSAARTLLRRYGLTPYALFCGAFGLLFGKLGGTGDTVIGTPVHGRTLPGTENIVGPLMKVMPVRLKTSGTVREYFDSVMTASAAMADHTGVTAAEIAGALGIKAKPGRGPLYGILFQTRPVDTGKMNIGSIECVYRPVPMNTSKLDLNIEAADEGGVFRLYFEYAVSVFEESTVRMMASSVSDVIRRLEKMSGDAPAEEAVSPSPEAMKLIEDSFTEAAENNQRPLHETISENARLYGDRTAVIFHGERTSFSELERESGRIAGLLKKAGVGRGDRVGLVCRRTPLMLAALTAILRRGAAYVPFLTSFPRDRAVYMMETAGAKAVLCDEAGAAAFPDGCFGVPCIDLRAACDPDGETVPVTGADTIYVLFTSGSTGRPKGVALPHRALSNLSSEMGRLWKGLKGPVLCSTNMTFDIFGTESLIALANGFTVLLADDSQMVLAGDLARLIREYGPDIAQFTPSKLAMCLRSREFSDSVSGLRFTILVGENVPPSLVSDFSRCCGGRLVNMYGPTEAAVYVTAGDLTAGEQVTIGKALGGCRLYVLDGEKRHCLPGARGELWLAGVCLADGYVSRPDLTEKVFVPDPFFPGERMYRTGDVARMRADGRFECFGRTDNQVKINGNRVEPGEIDEALLSAGASGAVTVVKKNPDGSSVLETIVTPANADTGRLLAKISSVLPAYMIPSKLCAVSSIPYNTSGKADVPQIKKMLDSSDGGIGVCKDSGSAPEATDEEARLLRVWSAVLGRDGLRPDVSFFGQGGSSLTALNVISEYSNLGIAMTLESFYANPTAAAQAAFLGSGATEPSAEPAVRFAESPAAFPAYTPEKSEGTVFVTGASGFLGAHVVKELAERKPETGIVCLTHEGGYQRLSGILDAYFGEGFCRTHRISAVEGDVTLDNFGMDRADYAELTGSTKAVIHCAADVRHYASDGGIRLTNVKGTANTAEFALRAGADMLHVSTASICGNYLTENPEKTAVFGENDFDIGQNRENRYIESKIAGEAEVYARMERGLRARVFRVGRLCGRYSDGVFQRNPDKNAFMRVVRGMRTVGAVPASLAEMPVELSPVDVCAEAIVLLKDADGTVFHPVQKNPFTLGKLLGYLAPDAVILGNDEFGERLRKAAAEYPDAVSSFVDFCNSALSGRNNIILSCERTHSALAARGFAWPEDFGASLRGFTGK